MAQVCEKNISKTAFTAQCLLSADVVTSTPLIRSAENEIVAIMSMSVALFWFGLKNIIFVKFSYIYSIYNINQLCMANKDKHWATWPIISSSFSQLCIISLNNYPLILMFTTITSLSNQLRFGYYDHLSTCLGSIALSPHYLVI